MTRQHDYKEVVSRQGNASVPQIHNEYMHQRLYDSDSQHTHSPLVPKTVESNKAGVSSATEFAPMVYTCPMYPEIRQDHPDTCPKCGMTLEPVMPAIEEEENAELAGFRRWLWASSPLTAIVFMLVMAGHRLTRLDLAWQDRLELTLITLVVLWVGLPFFRRCAQSFVYRSPDMWTLIGLGTGTAYLYSAVAVVTPGVSPSASTASGWVQVYFEAAAVVISLTLLGQMLELETRSQTSAAIKSLLGLAPKTARRINADDNEKDIPAAHVHVGDLLRVQPGEKVPVNGVVVAGVSVLDESVITGEPALISKRAGDHVIGATMSTSDILVIRSEKAGAQTVLPQIIQMVVRTRRSRTLMQRMADRVADVSVISVVGTAIMTPSAWGIQGPQPSWVHSSINTVAVLIIACPCALGPATLMFIMVASGKGAEHGILFWNAAVIEDLRKVDIPTVDKTGMLTEGRSSFDQVIGLSGFSNVDVLRLAASLNQGSEYPLAAVIMARTREQGFAFERPRDFESVSGIGVGGYVAGWSLALGDTSPMQAYAATVDAAPTGTSAMRVQGVSVIYLAVDGALAGLLSVSDHVKTTAPRALTQLRTDELRIVMATGDGGVTAQSAVEQFGIVESRGEVKPADKPALVTTLQERGLVVAMTGDGINDTPALAKADVDIMMSTNTDVTMNSVQVTLVKDDLRGTTRARALSEATIANTKRSLDFTFLYSVLDVPSAAGMLYPFAELLLSPIIAALAMSLSSAPVVANVPRLRATRF